jgi:hypothetical protein
VATEFYNYLKPIAEPELKAKPREPTLRFSRLRPLPKPTPRRRHCSGVAVPRRTATAAHTRDGDRADARESMARRRAALASADELEERARRLGGGACTFSEMLARAAELAREDGR